MGGSIFNMKELIKNCKKNGLFEFMKKIKLIVEFFIQSFLVLIKKM